TDQLVVTFTDVSGWMAQTISFPEELKGFNVFDIQIETDPGVKVMFKANNVGANEHTLTADAEGKINFVADYPEAISLVFFVNPGGETGVTGELVFTKSILRYVEPEFVPNEPIDLNNGFVGDDSGAYTITTDETGVKIDVSKVADQSYAHFYRDVTEAETAGRNTLKVTFKGTAGTSVIVKPNNDVSLEQTITFDANGDGVYEKLISGPLTKIVLMALPGQSGTAEEPLTASFHIIETEFRYVE
ncbi:MAG: hypothetical protein PHD47_01130, partial [Acholeplasmataceae bacterium]|nr:hypothetical protein [Acholeplasmataceae bacterium]